MLDRASDHPAVRGPASEPRSAPNHPRPVDYASGHISEPPSHRRLARSTHHKREASVQRSPVQWLKALRPDLERCNKCGFCMAGCPTYRAGGPLEWLTTRGRVSLIQDALEGTIPLSAIAPAVETCLLCSACLDHCPPKVDITALITGARAALREEQPLPAPARFLLRQVLPRPRLLRALAMTGAAGQRLGLRRRVGPLLKRWPTLHRANECGPELPGVTARRLLKDESLCPEGTAKARVAYFLSCTKEAIYPRAAVAAVRVLVAAGCEVVLPEFPCCGLPCSSAGDLEGAARLAERQREIMASLDVDALVSDDASCAAHLKEAVPVVEFASFLLEIGLPEAVHRIERKVTWHDPCSLRYALKAEEAPRRLIQAIPGIEYVEAAEADLCCGGAGSFMLTQPELADRLLQMKLEALQATGAQQVVTSSPSCLIQLGRVLPVISLAELLEEAYCAARNGG